MTDYPTQDSYGRPIAPVIGPTGRLLGYRRNDLPPGSLPAMSATPDGAYPADDTDRRRPMARPLTEAERATLAPLSPDHARDTLEANGLDPAAAGYPPLPSWTCGRCGHPVPLTGRALADGAALEIHDRTHDAPEPAPRCPAMVRLYDDDKPGSEPARFILCELPADHAGRHLDPSSLRYW